ncbi:MAG TPA: hypothetical protein VFV81_05775, partial [Verrucomicrobiae bacterium]|nr:hypothetical protein [Verrucomicrobiae bacterium]
MKTILVFAFTLITSTLIADTATNAAPASTNSAPQVVLTLPASAATLTAPMVLTNGVFGQTDSTELPQGGKATFTFTLTNAGTYVLKAVV